jgi:hypothetical protein
MVKIQSIDRFKLKRAKQGTRRSSWRIDHPIRKVGESLIDSLKQQFKEDLKRQVGGQTIRDMIIHHGSANYYEMFKQHIFDLPLKRLKVILDCTINQSIALHVSCNGISLNVTLQTLLKELDNGGLSSTEMSKIQPILDAAVNGKNPVELWEQIVLLAGMVDAADTSPIAEGHISVTRSVKTDSRYAGASQSTTTKDTWKNDSSLLEFELQDCEAQFGKFEGLWQELFLGKDKSHQSLHGKIKKPEKVTKINWDGIFCKGKEETNIGSFLEQLGFRVSGVVSSSINIQYCRNQRMDGLDQDIRMDAFIGKSTFKFSEKTYHNHIRQVYVPIELKRDDKCSSAALSSLLKYVDACFFGQPNRLFLHGLTIAGSQVTSYVFDRSSVYETVTFDFEKNLDLLATALCGYETMDQYQLGFDPTIKTENGIDYILVNDAWYEILSVVFRGFGIFCRSVKVFRVRHPQDPLRKLIVKDSWQESFREGREGKFYERANRCNVNFIPRLVVAGVVEDEVGGRQETKNFPCRKLAMKYLADVSERPPSLEANRVHYRMLLDTPVGQELLKQKNLSGLLKNISEVLDCKYQFHIVFALTNNRFGAALRQSWNTPQRSFP